jgi:hypothetical protein
MKTGRFYGYTQFKQEQLLSRLKRCSFQLKQLGAGVAVVAALGMATPAVGQSYNLVELMVPNNPVMGPSNVESTTFVDIDGDGDKDLFTTKYGNGVEMEYYENTGTATSPNFVLQPGTSSPFNLFSPNMYDLTFVDLDGDLDLDAFATTSFYVGQTFIYYENIGSATNPMFSGLTGASNPLDSVNIHVSDLNLTMNTAAHPSFVDIDNDGDQDCFIGAHPYYYWATNTDVADKLWYYENIGTSTAPVFQRTSNANNPLGNIMADPLINAGNRVQWGIQFLDGDTDGDQDGLICIEFDYHYLRNTGTASAPIFQIAGTPTPLDSIKANTFTYQRHVNYVDLDGDLDFDVVARAPAPTNSNSLRYFENVTPVGITKLKESAEVIELYPNPTSGNITLDRAVTGQLNVFNVTGQKVYTKALESTQNVNLSSLQEGTYLLSIKEGDKYLQQTIVIQK